MAYKRDNLTPVGNNAKAGVVPVLYMLFNEASDTVTTKGFIPQGEGLHAKDQVMVIDADGGNNKFYNVTVDAAGDITLVLNA